MSSSPDSTNIDYLALLAERRQLIQEEEVEYERKRAERAKELRELAKKAKEQAQWERRRSEKDPDEQKRRADEERRKRAEARQVDIDTASAIMPRKRAFVSVDEDAKSKRALSKEIKAAMAKFPERPKGHVDRYNPHLDGYNYGLNTRWEDDENTPCSRCKKAGVICWRRVINLADFHPCLRCRDIRRTCDLGDSASAPITRQKRARMEVESESEDEGMSTKMEATPARAQATASVQKVEDVSEVPTPGRATDDLGMVESLAKSIERLKEAVDAMGASAVALSSVAEDARRCLTSVVELQDKRLDIEKERLAEERERMQIENLLREERTVVSTNGTRH